MTAEIQNTTGLTLFNIATNKTNKTAMLEVIQ